MKWIVRNTNGDILGTFEDVKEDGCLGWILLIVLGLFLGIILFGSIISVPVFVLFYLKKTITYLYIAGIVFINYHLFLSDNPVVNVTLIEGAIFSVILFIHNLGYTSSAYEGIENINKHAEKGLVEAVIVWTLLIVHCILGAIILNAIASLIAVIIIKLKGNSES